jgi:hypothetical protein
MRSKLPENNCCHLLYYHILFEKIIGGVFLITESTRNSFNIFDNIQPIRLNMIIYGR